MHQSQSIRAFLFSLQDKPYRDFTAKLLPTVDKDTIIGIRAPVFQKAAKEIYKAGGFDAFLAELPHDYFEETNLHAYLVTQGKDFDTVVRELDRLLPYVDNWATCDSIRAPVFKKQTDALFPHCLRWMESDHPYTVRFGMLMLMTYCLDDAFSPAVPRAVAEVRSDHYYVRMMAAWFFATALAKQWDAVIGYLEDRLLEPDVHKKTIQKARESFRITPEQKEYLKTLR